MNRDSNRDSSISDEKSEKQQLVQKDEGEKKKITYELKTCNCFGKTIDLPLVALMLMNFFLNAACSVITPFFPPLATGEYDSAPDLKLSMFQVGFVIGIHPASGFLFGMLMSKYLMQFGRKKVMLGSIVVTIITSLGMGLCYHLRNQPTAFFVINLICRSFMGMARSGYGSATFAYAPMLWPQKVERMIGMLESATGLGLMMGPLIGALIASIFSFSEAYKYQMVFYILSAFFCVFVYPSYTMLPEDQRTPSKQKTLSLFKVFGRRQIWTLFFLLTFVSTSVTFTYELWTNHMATYGIGENMAAVWLTTGSMTYIVSLQTIPLLMGKYIREKGLISFRKVLESIGIGASAILLLFMAPETALGMPQDAWPLILGMFGAGYAQGLAILPYIPEQNMLIVKLYPKNAKLELAEKLTEQVTDQLEQTKLASGKEFTQEDVEANVGEIIRKLYSDMAAGMFMSGYSLGTFAGPTIGGFIFDFIENSEAAINSDNCNWARNTGKANPCANQYAFKSLAEYICIACVIFTVLYLTLGEGYKGWQDLCCRKKKEQLTLDKPLQPNTRKSLSEYNSKEGNLTDALITDNDNQFTDEEQNNVEYDEETEEKLQKIIESTENDAKRSSGEARSGSLIM